MFMYIYGITMNLPNLNSKPLSNQILDVCTKCNTILVHNML